ncbi:MAG: sugar transferase [Sphingomonadales bacterium]|nr:sugar transferase [Sphingomonadales bacterium]
MPSSGLKHCLQRTPSPAPTGIGIRSCVTIRATRLGRFYRKASIDELPQLIKRSAGEMSIVGPRPVSRA